MNFLLSSNIEQTAQSLSKFELLSIIFSALAFALSVVAFIVSIVKLKKENKNYKLNYVINNLTKVSQQLEYYYNEIEKLNVEIRLLSYVKELQSKDKDFQIDIYNIYREFSFLHTNLALWLLHYKPTENTSSAIKHLNNLSTYVSSVLKLANTFKDNKTAFLEKFLELKATKVSKLMSSDKLSIILEINTTISKLLKGKLSLKEIDTFLHEVDFAKEYQKHIINPF